MSENELPDIVKFWTDYSRESKHGHEITKEIVLPEPEATGLQGEVHYLPVTEAEIQAEQAIQATTEIVKARPDLDEAVTILSEQARRAAAYATTITIDTLDDQRRVVQDLGAIAGLKKRLEAKRLEYTDPLTKLSRKINDQFKDITIPLNEADGILRKLDKDFQYALDALRAAAETEERLRLIAEQEQAAKSGEIIETKPSSILSEPEPTSTMRVETGTRHFRENPKWALLDLDKVPREWLKLDEAKITGAVKAGMQSIPGIKIWSEREAVVRAREDK